MEKIRRSISCVVSVKSSMSPRILSVAKKRIRSSGSSPRIYFDDSPEKKSEHQSAMTFQNRSFFSRPPKYNRKISFTAIFAPRHFR